MAMEYDTLEIEISRCCCGRREVRLLESPVDRPRARQSVSEERLHRLSRWIDRYDKLFVAMSPEGLSERRKLAEAIGSELYILLTPGRVGQSLREALALLDEEREHRQGGRLLRVSFGAGENYDPEMASLPWELIFDREAGGRFPAAEPQTQVVRYLDVVRKSKPLLVEPPLRILAVLASPNSLPQIDLEAQELALRRAVEHSDGRIELSRLPRPTLEVLQATLAEQEDRGCPFHGIHFLGHGEFTEGGEGALYFEREDRARHVVRGKTLATQLSAFRDLRLVVLASCAGARLPRQAGRGPFTGAATALIATNIPAVVAMQFTVSEQAAAAFARGFYAALGARGSVIEATAEGRCRILAEDTEGTEWATPVLFLRPADGRVLEVSDEAAARRESSTEGGVYLRAQMGRIETDGRVSITGDSEKGAAGPPRGSVQVDVSAEDVKAGEDVILTGRRRE